MALASATVFVGAEHGWYVVGATVDHRLQEGSEEVAAAVVARLAALGVDETLTVRATVDAPGLGPEAAAREARYALLEQVRESFDAEVVLLGHTRDDQAETVLLGLARGSGGRALAGMRRAVRPLSSSAARRLPHRHGHRLPGRGRSRCGKTRTTPTRPTPGCACGSGSSRSSRTSSALGSPRRSPAPPTSCGPTWSCSTPTPPTRSRRDPGGRAVRRGARRAGASHPHPRAAPGRGRRRRTPGRALPPARRRRRRPRHRLARPEVGRPPWPPARRTTRGADRVRSLLTPSHDQALLHLSGLQRPTVRDPRPPGSLTGRLRPTRPAATVP